MYTTGALVAFYHEVYTRFIDEYLPVFKAMNKNKMKQDNRLYKIEIREADKGKKRIKIHYKSLSEHTNR